MKHKGTCYYCGSPATSREHIPPRLLFNCTDCDSITVPSCDSHNTEKCGSDQAIANAMASALLPVVRRPEYQSSSPARCAVEHLAEELHRTSRLITQVTPIEDGSVSLTYLHAEASFNNWVRQMTAGLVFDAVGPASSSLDWGTAAVFSPSRIPSRTPEIEADELLQQLLRRQEMRDSVGVREWRMGWSAHPRPYPRDLYRFEFARAESGIVFRHWFFNQFDVFVFFEAATAIHEGICRKAGCLQ